MQALATTALCVAPIAARGFLLIACSPPPDITFHVGGPGSGGRGVLRLLLCGTPRD